MDVGRDPDVEDDMRRDEASCFEGSRDEVTRRNDVRVYDDSVTNVGRTGRSLSDDRERYEEKMRRSEATDRDRRDEGRFRAGLNPVDGVREDDYVILDSTPRLSWGNDERAVGTRTLSGTVPKYKAEVHKNKDDIQRHEDAALKREVGRPNENRESSFRMHSGADRSGHPPSVGEGREGCIARTSNELRDSNPTQPSNGDRFRRGNDCAAKERTDVDGFPTNGAQRGACNDAISNDDQTRAADYRKCNTKDAMLERNKIQDIKSRSFRNYEDERPRGPSAATISPPMISYMGTEPEERSDRAARHEELPRDAIPRNRAFLEIELDEQYKLIEAKIQQKAEQKKSQLLESLIAKLSTKVEEKIARRRPCSDVPPRQENLPRAREQNFRVSDMYGGLSKTVRYRAEPSSYDIDARDVNGDVNGTRYEQGSPACMSPSIDIVIPQNDRGSINTGLQQREPGKILSANSGGRSVYKQAAVGESHRYERQEEDPCNTLRDAVTRRSRREWLLPDKFDGQSTSWSAFIAKFKICSSYNGWDASDNLAHLQLALRGNADHVLWADPSKKWTFHELVYTLDRRYGNSGQAALYRAELSGRRRGREESLLSLHQDILRLMSLAYEGPRSIHTDAFAVDAFLKSLDDPELSNKVRELDPQDLDEAVRHARRLESYAYCSKPFHARDDQRHNRRDNGHARAVVRRQKEEQLCTTPPSEPAPYSAPNSQTRTKAEIIKRLEEELHTLKTQIKNNLPIQQQNVSSVQPLVNGWTNNGISNQSGNMTSGFIPPLMRSEVLNTNHQDSATDRYRARPFDNRQISTVAHTNGPQNRSQGQGNTYLGQQNGPSRRGRANQSQYNYEQSRALGECRRIQRHEKQYIRRPSKTSQGQWRDRRSASLRFKQSLSRRNRFEGCFVCKRIGHWKSECPFRRNKSSTASRSAAPALRMIRVGRAASSPSKRSCLELEVYGIKYLCRLDSGCDSTVVPINLVPASKISVPPGRLYAANGTEILIEGEAVVQFTLDGIDLSVVALVSSKITEVTLGLDWMSKFNVLWNFASCQVTVRGRRFSLVAQTESRLCRRVLALSESKISDSKRNKVDVKYQLNGSTEEPHVPLGTFYQCAENFHAWRATGSNWRKSVIEAEVQNCVETKLRVISSRNNSEVVAQNAPDAMVEVNKDPAIVDGNVSDAVKDTSETAYGFTPDESPTIKTSNRDNTRQPDDGDRKRLGRHRLSPARYLDRMREEVLRRAGHGDD